MEFLWYIPNQVTAGHRSDTTVAGHNSLSRLTDLARLTEDHGWGGALIGTGWRRPDTFTVSTALAASTTTFNPLIAIRPGYWTPAHFASSAATLDQLSGGRVKVNIVSGADHQPQYGDDEGDQAQRYARTREFMRLVRRYWTEDDVTFEGDHYRAEGATLEPQARRPRRPPAPAALLRRCLRGRPADRGRGGRRPALLGRAARRRRRPHRAPARPEHRARPRPAAAAVRPAHHDAGA